jgi:hypothetical protein
MAASQGAAEIIQKEGGTPAQDALYEAVIQQARTMQAFKLAKNDREPAEICEGLFLGSIGAAMSKETLQRLGISVVMTVSDNIKPLFPELFTYEVIPILDDPSCDISGLLPHTYDMIESALRDGHKVLVHCFAGKSRSGAVVVAYLMRKLGLTLQAALLNVQERRPIVEPNIGFMQQLEVFERALGLQDNK